MKTNTIRVVVALAASVASGLAAAHTGEHELGGFLSGLSHPLMGLDHLAVMLAVGLWIGFRAQRQAGQLVAAYVGFLVLGAVVGMSAPILPGVETGIAASVLVASLLMATLVRLPLAASMLLVAGFALFNGAAHGAGMPLASMPLLYGLGLLFASGALQLASVRLGGLLQRGRAAWVLRGLGVLGGGLGAWLLLGA
ncbi:MAG: HupE/UreJ family protein [Gammaproteobacteria bacterium]|nr:HupE/UreJ family protein [Gammaproteobacteria bacterium]MCF6361925.1 HupE/UreJ family protein [Gammaproteobacteria bacterium]